MTNYACERLPHKLAVAGLQELTNHRISHAVLAKMRTTEHRMINAVVCLLWKRPFTTSVHVRSHG
jgi:hypothetical protein